MKRHKYSLSNYKLATFNMGELIPVGLQEVIPGDTFQHATSMLLRVTPLLTPVMHPVHVRIHHWFVPMRLVWDQWEDFITGGPQGTSTPSIPTINLNSSSGGTLLDYLGAAPTPSSTTLAINALPLYAVNLIWNEFYRDQDLQTARNLNAASVPRVAWQKDYFTTARPWAQKGPQVTVPMATTVTPLPNPPSFTRTFNGAVTSPLGVSASASPPVSAPDLTAGGIDSLFWADPQLEVTGNPSIDSFRRAFAIQRYQEARAQYGSRYSEYLRYLGVRSSDARLQRPEYLGGGKQTIAFSEVLQTGPDTSGDGVADIRGHGIAAMRSRRYRRFFEEHGYIISLCSVVPKTMYANSVSRLFLRQTKEDFWQRELQQIGQQEVLNGELYASSSGTARATFGYQDRYDEYRRTQSTIAGEFRTVLNDWHFARIFSNTPVLNSSFVEANPPDRPFAEKTQDSLWCMFQHSIQARRMVTRNTIGRLV